MRSAAILVAICAAGCACCEAAAAREKVLYRFDGYTGVSPDAVLIPDKHGNFYSATYLGGGGNNGTVFELSRHQTLSVIYSFRGLPDGSEPIGAPVRDDNGNLYGTTYAGGGHDLGTVFRIASDGSETILHSFAGRPGDGEWPSAGLVADKSGNLFGTTQEGGIGNGGEIFRIAADRTYTIFYQFCVKSLDCDDGAGPYAGLIVDNRSNFYGTTSAGGSYGYGVAFELAPDGTETVIHSFAGGRGDGIEPLASLLRDKQGNLYGTTFLGGRCASGGTVFEIRSDRTESVLHDFCGSPDGAEPEPALIMDGKGNLYGTTVYGGGSANCEYGCGTVFEISPDGSETVVHAFKGRRDGAWPSAGLVEQGGILFGTTGGGGSPYWCSGVGCGTIFEIAR